MMGATLYPGCVWLFDAICRNPFYGVCRAWSAFNQLARTIFVAEADAKACHLGLTKRKRKARCLARPWGTAPDIEVAARST